MGWLDRFRAPRSSPNARVHIPAIQQNVGNPEQFRASALRRRPTSHTPHETPPSVGMWVRYGDNTGIITALTSGDTYTVALADDHGENKGIVRVNGQELRQAYYEEIPPIRRPPFETAASFGYHPRPT